MKILVTDGHNRAALAITRSLGRLGHHVMVGDQRTDSIAQASRYCSERVTYPDPVTSPDAFVDRLATLARQRDVDVLIPVSDIATFMVTGQRERFACAVPCADAAIVERAANKADIMATAARLGVPVPRGVLVTKPDDVPAVEHLGFPVVIKPWRSRIRTAAGWASTAVSFADDPGQLAADLTRRPIHEFPLLIQERVSGPGVGVFACYHDGAAVALFSHQRLRERPPWGGVSVLSESTELDPAARDYATRLLDAIGWQGVAMVEFKRDERDGLPKLMEINGRFWGSLQLAIDAGVDFPALLLQTVQDRAFAPQVPYRVGLRERWLLGDLDALLAFLRPGANARRLAGRSRARAIGDFLHVWAPDLHYDNPKIDDVRPFLSETRAWFRDLTRGDRRIAVETRNAPAVCPNAGVRQVRFATSFEEAGVDEAAWNGLVAASQTDSVFQTYQWARSWWETYAKHRSLLLVTASECDRVRALAPLVIDHRPTGERVGCFLGFGRADYSDVLSSGGDTGLVEAMINELLESEHWDRLDLHNIPVQSEFLPVIRQCCMRQSFR
jgi:predicted ATP-grasp superfamily ATP-dependent carboligase